MCACVQSLPVPDSFFVVCCWGRCLSAGTAYCKGSRVSAYLTLTYPISVPFLDGNFPLKIRFSPIIVGRMEYTYDPSLARQHLKPPGSGAGMEMHTGVP